jgi:hypothetical protein
VCGAHDSALLPGGQKVMVANKALLQPPASPDKAHAYTAPRRRLTKSVV